MMTAGALRYFTTIRNGSTPASGESSYWDGEIPWATPDDLGRLSGNAISRTKRTITPLAVTENNLNIVPSKTVLMSTRAPIGHMAITSSPMAFNQGCRALIPNQQTFGPYLLYVLKSRVEELNACANGTTFVELSRDDLASVRIELPPLKIQERIAAFLDDKTARIDSLIAKKQSLLEKLAEKRQAIITQAVTRGLNASAPLKDSGIDWIGQVPTHWEIKRLKYVSPRVTVGIVVTPAAYYADEGILALRGLNVRTMGFDLTDTRNITQDGNDLNSKSTLHEGDLVAVRTGTPGTTAVVTKELAGSNCIDLIIIRKSPDASSRFLGWFLNSSAAQAQYTIGAEGALQQHFNVDTSKEVVVSLPPLAEQVSIAEWIDRAIAAHDLQVGKVEQSIKRLDEYRAALITAAVTDQIEELR